MKKEKLEVNTVQTSSCEIKLLHVTTSENYETGYFQNLSEGRVWTCSPYGRTRYQKKDAPLNPERVQTVRADDGQSYTHCTPELSHE